MVLGSPTVGGGVFGCGRAPWCIWEDVYVPRADLAKGLVDIRAELLKPRCLQSQKAAGIVPGQERPQRGRSNAPEGPGGFGSNNDSISDSHVNNTRYQSCHNS